MHGVDYATEKKNIAWRRIQAAVPIEMNLDFLSVRFAYVRLCGAQRAVLPVGAAANVTFITKNALRT
jgi:hypothetical protein